MICPQVTLFTYLLEYSIGQRQAHKSQKLHAVTMYPMLPKSD
uniref:Uncharacterized protein n=1 Tax=Arundo donax TaxID=35708 RepID=A0A0A9T0I2_ARUDO